MSSGTTICYYMLGGEQQGCIRCTRKVWTIISYKIPRIVAKKCTNVPDLQKSGIYFLFGENENGDPTVYIGQASARKNGEGILKRMLEPHGKSDDKKENPIDAWTEAVVLTAKSDELGATELCYLEHQFHDLAVKAKQATVLNGLSPSKGKPSEEEESDMLAYMEQAKTMLSALGYDFLEPNTKQTEESDEPLVYLEKENVKAKGRYTTKGFIVYEGSIIRPDVTPKCPDSIISLRKKHETSVDNSKVKDDITFKTPSAAAGFVTGSSVNGWIYWKTEDGKTLKELEAAKTK